MLSSTLSISVKAKEVFPTGEKLNDSEAEESLVKVLGFVLSF